MIYSDSCASDDREDVPACRSGEKCLNCGDNWGNHMGWACNPKRLLMHMIDFSKCLPHERYITESMLFSVGNTVQMAEGTEMKTAHLGAHSRANKEPEIEDWRVWRGDKPGECACGIVREICEYHRG